MRILVEFLEPISGPFGTYIVDAHTGAFKRWLYCRQVDGKWYFVTKQKAGDAIPSDDSHS